MPGPVKFLTDQGAPLHPIVETSDEPDGKVYVKAVLNQSVFPGERPGLDDEHRYIHMRLDPDKHALLPEGNYDIDDAGSITNITAPTVDPALFRRAAEGEEEQAP